MGAVDMSRYIWTNIDNLTFTPDNYAQEFVYPRPLFDVKTSDSAAYFKALCTTPERIEKECHGWSDEDLRHLREAQTTVHNFQAALHQYYDLAFQMIWVLYVWGAGLYLLWKRHFTVGLFPDPHRFDTTIGIKWFLNFHTTFTAEEIKTIVVTDSEDDEQIFYGVDLSDYVSASSEEERQMRRKNPNEYGRLLSRKFRHEDELKNPKYNKKRKIKRRKRALPNVNNPMHGTTVRNFDPPKNAGKKFDSFGTPKYPRIYEIRRMINQPNRFLARL